MESEGNFRPRVGNEKIKLFTKQLGRLLVFRVNGYVFISLKDVISVKASGRYTLFYLTDEELVLSPIPISHYFERLKCRDFLWVNNCVFLNPCHIEEIRIGRHLTVEMSNERHLQINNLSENNHLLSVANQLFKSILPMN